MNNTRDAIRRSLKSMVRRWSRFAWEEMLFDVGRVEWKYGRNDNGTPKDWTEWNNVRVHLRESGKLRQPQELESPNAGTQRPGTSDAEPATRTPMPGSLK